MNTKSKKTVTVKTATPKASKAKTTATPKAKVSTPKAKVSTPKAKTVKATTVKSVSKKAKTSNRVTVPVIQFTVRGRRIKKYNSISEAQRATGVNTGSISKAVRGIVKTAGGFRWTNV